MVGRKSGAVIIDSYAMTAVWQGKQRGLKRVSRINFLCLCNPVSFSQLDMYGIFDFCCSWPLIVMWLQEQSVMKDTGHSL